MKEVFFLSVSKSNGSEPLQSSSEAVAVDGWKLKERNIQRNIQSSVTFRTSRFIFVCPCCAILLTCSILALALGAKGITWCVILCAVALHCQPGSQGDKQQINHVTPNAYFLPASFTTSATSRLRGLCFLFLFFLFSQHRISHSVEIAFVCFTMPGAIKCM